jgi:hypothetical protein
MATYDGSNIFGFSRIRMEVNPSAAQVNEFFGAQGQQSLYGGSRGRVFLIEGIWTGDNDTLAASVATMLSYDDGIGRAFAHPIYGTWPRVVFRRFVPGERILFGALQYKAQFDGLI